MAETDLEQAIAEYSSGATPFSGLQDFFLNRPVFDRGPRPDPVLPTVRTLDFANFDQGQRATELQNLIDQQAAQQQSDRQAALDTLRDTLQEQLSTAAEAEAAERSNVVRALEERLSNVRENIAAEQSELRDLGVAERADLRAEQQALVDTLQANIDSARADLLESQARVEAAQTGALGDLEARQTSIVENLRERISGLNDDLGSISTEIRSELAEQEASLSEEQRSAGSELQSKINDLSAELKTVSESVGTETERQAELLRGERETALTDLEEKIGSLREEIGQLPLDDINARIEQLSNSSATLAQTADTERAELARRIEQLTGQAVTPEDLERALGDRVTSDELSRQLEGIRSQLVDPDRISTERAAAIQAAIDPLSAERAQAISSAVDPIQQQIEALRGQIPQQIDTEALRKQITEEVMANLPQQQAAPADTATPPVTVGSAEGQQDISVEPEGDALAASMNLSDGQADALGLFDDPRPMQQFNPSSDMRDTIAIPTPRQNQMTGRTGAFIPETTVAPTASNAFSSLVGLQAANVPENQTPVVGNIAVRADRTPKPRGIVPLTPATPKVKRRIPAQKPLPVMTAPIRFDRFTR